MKSKRYFRSAIVSVFLLAGCLLPADNGRDTPVSTHRVDTKSEKKAEKKSEKKAETEDLALLTGRLSPYLTGPPMADDDEGDDDGTDGAHDGCAPGEMMFEGDCMMKEDVSDIIEEHERKRARKQEGRGRR